MLALLAAIQFLTRIPMPIRIPYSPLLLARSTIYYPLVGGVIGLVLIITTWFVGLWWPAEVNAVLIVIVWVMLTGALHLDGLLDSADGLLSHRSREQMLSIMKDSRIGAMGAIVAVLYLALKMMLLYVLLSQITNPSLFLILLITPMASRWMMVLAMGFFPYARKDEGLGSSYKSVGHKHVVLSSFVLLVCLLLVDVGLGKFFGSLQGFSIISILIGVALLIGGSFCLYCWRKLGGMTGDTYGAVNELVEVAMLLAFLSIGGD